MDITSLSGISSDYLNSFAKNQQIDKHTTSSFGDVFANVMSSINETNDLQNQAESAEIQFALGLSDNTHDLLIAETKAEIALQYTVAVRDKMIEAYKELMQMQI